MKWIETPNAYLVHSHCNGNDGTNSGWVAELVDTGKMTYQAWICNGYKAATELGSHYKTPRLAQMAVERELLKRWFSYEWEHSFNDAYTLWVNRTYLFHITVDRNERPAILARAKREFLNEL